MKRHQECADNGCYMFPEGSPQAAECPRHGCRLLPRRACGARLDTRHRQAVCDLPEGHDGPHWDGGAVTWDGAP